MCIHTNFIVSSSSTTIFYSSLCSRRVIRAGNLPHPYGITVFNDKLYWTDWKKKSILSCNKNQCTDVDTILSDLKYPMDIDVYESSRQPGK